MRYADAAEQRAAQRPNRAGWPLAQLGEVEAPSEEFGDRILAELRGIREAIITETEGGGDAGMSRNVPIREDTVMIVGENKRREKLTMQSPAANTLTIEISPDPAFTFGNGFQVVVGDVVSEELKAYKGAWYGRIVAGGALQNLRVIETISTTRAA